MIARAYVQLVPTRDRYGRAKSVRVGRVTKGMPNDPEPGALLVALSIDVDEGVFAIPTVRVQLDGDPQELAAAVVPHPVSVEEEDVQGGDA